MAKTVTHNGLTVNNRLLKNGNDIIGDTTEKYALFPTTDHNSNLEKRNVTVLDCVTYENNDTDEGFLKVLQLARQHALSNSNDLIVNHELTEKFNVINHVLFNGNRMPMTFDEVIKLQEVSPQKIIISPNPSEREQFMYAKRLFSPNEPTSTTNFGSDKNVPVNIDTEINLFDRDVRFIFVYLVDDKHNEGETLCDLSHLSVRKNDDMDKFDTYIHTSKIKNPYIVNLPKVEDSPSNAKTYIYTNHIHELSKLHIKDADNVPVIINVSNMDHYVSLVAFFKELVDINAMSFENISETLILNKLEHDITKEHIETLYDDALHLKTLFDDNPKTLLTTQKIMVDGTIDDQKLKLNTILEHKDIIEQAVATFSKTPEPRL